jgi:xylulokinase
VSIPGVHRHGLAPDDGPGHVRAVVEAQQMALALHSRWMGVRVDTIHATGGAAANVEILQVMADVFGADVCQLEVPNAACLGAALRAYHADRRAAGEAVPWSEVIRGFVEPKLRLRPDAARHAIYQALLRKYEAFEASHLTPSNRSTTS